MDNENLRETPSYYAIIPANVRYSKDLSAQEKLLYAEITALANKKGYCFASNAYFSKLYGQAIRTIRRQVSNLEKFNFISTHIIYNDDTKEVLERRIYLKQEVFTPGDKNVPTPGDKNVPTPGDKNVPTPGDKNVPHNNTST